VLLVHANEVVSMERLVDELWGDDPPATARNMIQGYVAGLRARLGRDALRTEQGGYLLRVAPGALDVHRFEALMAEADRQLAAGAPGSARSLLCEALALWRGPALVGTISDTLSQSVAAGLEDRHLDALEKRVDADLQLGRAGALVGELRALAAAHPLREGLQARLVLALHRSGRHAEAMAACRAAGDRLRRELGVEPGPELRRAERAVRLPVEAKLELPAQVPAQLPPSIGDFTGRAPELAALRELLERRDAVSLTVVVISGQGGVGKTSLALRAAHQLRSRFPDGQLFADLRAGEPRAADAGEVLAGFLRALGIDGAAIPQDLEERTALYRARLAGRSLLVVLDNAASEAPIRSLLPGGADCAAIVTSRSPLAGLEAARTLALGMLRPDEAVELLTRVAGPPRVVAEPAAAARIAELCGHLPLAVRIAGARLAARPHWTLRRLAERLGDERIRLDELMVGDLEVRASLELSYAGLDPAARRSFRLLGLLDSPDFADWLAAGLLGVPVAAGGDLLERLADAQLLEVVGEDCTGQIRYRFHPLLRAFARERADSEEPAAVRTAALEAALGTQIALSAHAQRVLSPGGNAQQMPVRTGVRWREPEPSLAARVEADPLGWCEAERAGLVAGVRQAAGAEAAELAWELAGTLPTFYGIRGYWEDWQTTHEVAIAVCSRAGNRYGEAQLLRLLGVAFLWLGEARRAGPCFERSRALAVELGDAWIERWAQLGLGLVMATGGQAAAAEEDLERTLASFRQAGEASGEAVALLGLAECWRVQKRLEEAGVALDACLEIFRETDPHWEAIALLSLGDLHRAAGRLDDAETSLVRALRSFRQFGNLHFATLALYRLAKVQGAQGRQRDAADSLNGCLSAFRHLGLRGWEDRALNQLARLERV
jgi:DNA-binding SARP family transcriptional activator